MHPTSLLHLQNVDLMPAITRARAEKLLVEPVELAEPVVWLSSSAAMLKS
jgi:hypothetical protein